MNLLEHLIMLYVRVRIFSLVKDNCELYIYIKLNKKIKKLYHCEQLKSKKHQAVWNKGIEPKKSQTVYIILLKRLFL